MLVFPKNAEKIASIIEKGLPPGGLIYYNLIWRGAYLRGDGGA